MFVGYRNKYVNLMRVKYFELYKNKIYFYFSAKSDNYTIFEFENEDKASNFLHTHILPMFNERGHKWH